MKECPNCKSIFANDLFFCLHDGAPLAELKERDSREPTSVPTEVWPKPALPAPRSRAVWPYVIIGFLLLISVGLASAILLMYRDRASGSSSPNSNSTAVAPVSPTPQPTLAISSPTIKPTATADPAQLNAEIAITDPTGRWTGEWSTKSGTLLDIQIDLADTRNDGLDGQIRWTLRRTVREDKMNKVGLSAIEFVRGSYDPMTRTVRMTGYKKDDPENVLVMLDEYSLKVSPDGRKLSGVARNGGRWNGYLNLSR